MYDACVERPRILAPWIRRGIEAGILAALLSLGSIVGYHFSQTVRVALPQGIDGALILLPAVLALAAFAVVYPTFLAATRADAVLGAIAAFLVAADLLMAVSLVVGDQVVIHSIHRSVPLGLLAAGWALPVAAIALAFGQLSTPLGFGRSAGLRSATAAIVISIIAVLAAARFT